MKKPLEVLKLYADHDYTLNGTLASRAAQTPGWRHRHMRPHRRLQLRRSPNT